MKGLLSRLRKSADRLGELLGCAPEVGLILGSGLGELAEKIIPRGQADYSSLPGFPVSTATGHAGRLIWGSWAGKKILGFQGRFHVYEGYSLSEVAFPVWLMKLLGCRFVITTNAAGSLNPKMPAGSIMVVTDHINLLGGSPLIEPGLDELGTRFVDMSRVYAPELVKLALRVAAREGIPLRSGVLTAVSGPNYETAAEYRACCRLGADAVGMSVIPEAIAAAHCGLKAMAFSGLSDECFNFPLKSLTPEEVLSISRRIAPALSKLVTALLPELA